MEKKISWGKSMKLLIIFLALSMLSFSFISAREIDCLIDRPMASWQFNEGNGTNAQDSCYGYNTTFYGSVEWTNQTIYNNAVKFNGIDSYIDAGNFFNQDMQEFSFSLWTNISYKIAYQTLFQSGNYYTNEFIEAIQINEGDNDYVLFMSDSSVDIKVIDDGVWHHVMGTFNGSDNGNVSLYIDGVFISSVLTYLSKIDATTGLLYFGANYVNGFILDGSLDEIAFFNRTLSPQEVYDIYSPPHNDDLSIILYALEYPYVELNSSYLVRVKLFSNDTELLDGNLILELREKNGSVININLPYSIDGYYENAIIFNETGDYPFLIEANSLSRGYINVSGQYSVRSSFFITVKIYKAKDLTAYKNDFAFITAEYPTYERYALDPLTEALFKPQYFISAFHSPYINGESTIKLYDSNRDYTFRAIDGQITFSSLYSVPNISRSYGLDTTLTTRFLNNSNQTLSFYVTDKELRPLTYLLNASLIIGLILVLIVTIILFFAYPEMPVFALIFGALFTFILLAFRVIVWVGWSQ
jgi:hypothetical protein